MSAAEKYGCNDATLRRLFKRGGIKGRYERSDGRGQSRLTFEEKDLEEAFAGPLAHVGKAAQERRVALRRFAELSPAEQAELEARLDVRQAAERYSCSQARIRQSFKSGALHGEHTLAQGRDGRSIRKLTFDVADLDACFLPEVTAEERRAAHVAKIRATAGPFTGEQKKAIASVLLDHLTEKKQADLAECEDEGESSLELSA